MSSRALWDRVAEIGNIPQRSSESLRNLFKKSRDKTINEVLASAKDAGMRFSHSFKFPRRPFVSPEVDQNLKTTSPSKKTNKGGRPRKNPSERSNSKRAKQSESPSKSDGHPNNGGEANKATKDKSDEQARDGDDILPDDEPSPNKSASQGAKPRKREAKNDRKRRTLTKKTPPQSEADASDVVVSAIQQESSRLSLRFDLHDKLESPPKGVLMDTRSAKDEPLGDFDTNI